MLPACVRDQFVQAVRAAQPWAQHFHPTAPRTTPAISRVCRVPAIPGVQWWGQEHRAPCQAGREDRASLIAAAAAGGDGLCAWSSPWRDVRSGPPLGDLLVFCFFFHFAGQAAEQNTWLRESKDGAGAPSGTSMQHTQWQWGTKEKNSRDAKKGGGKKKKKKIGHQQPWEPKATRERDSARHHSTCHRRQTDRQPRADQIRKISPLRDPH